MLISRLTQNIKALSSKKIPGREVMNPLVIGGGGHLSSRTIKDTKKHPPPPPPPVTGVFFQHLLYSYQNGLKRMLWEITIKV